MESRHVLIFIHGITPVSQPGSHHVHYSKLLNNIFAAKPRLQDLFDRIIFVEWGHEQGPTSPRPDQRIMRAQKFSHSLLKHKYKFDFTLVPLRRVFKQLKTSLVLGFSDALYYCSEDGEQAVRSAVYSQVLDGLRKFKNDTVYLHVIGHSLGCTVAFDFLYGLFAPSKNWKKKKPDVSSEKYGKEFLLWRKKAAKKELILSSKISLASQLPATLLRKQKVVDILYEKKQLDPIVIGVGGKQVQWKVFFDVDDILSFPCAKLFKNEGAIVDIQVDTGDMPDSAHNYYWKNEKVAKECAKLLHNF